VSKVAILGRVFVDLLYTQVERIPNVGEEVYSKGFDIQLGGGPIAYAALLNGLGIDVNFGTFFSGGIRSSIAKKILSEMNFSSWENLYKEPLRTDVDPVMITSVISLEHDRSFISYGDAISDTLTSEELFKFFKGCEYAFSLPWDLQAMCHLKKEGTKFIHTTYWHDEMDISREIEVLSHSEIFALNDKEALQLTKCRTVEEAIEELSRYVKVVIVTLGNEGALVRHNQISKKILQKNTFNAVDTTGAGDNFIAGVMYGLCQGWNIDKCVQFGNISGGYSTTAVGCVKASLTLEKALELMKVYQK